MFTRRSRILRFGQIHSFQYFSKKLDCTHGADRCISSKRKRLQAKLNKVCNIQRKTHSSANIFHASATKAIQAIRVHLTIIHDLCDRKIEEDKIDSML